MLEVGVSRDDVAQSPWTQDLGSGRSRRRAVTVLRVSRPGLASRILDLCAARAKHVHGDCKSHHHKHRQEAVPCCLLLR